MSVETVFEHYVDPSRLRAGGWVLDVGCLHGEFARHFASQGFQVLAVDPNPEISPPAYPGLHFERVAVVPESLQGMTPYRVCRADPQCNHVVGVGIVPETYPGLVECGMTTVMVPSKSLPQLMDEYGVNRFELAKFDCEGSECLLLEMGAFARQVTVEFHLHMGQPEQIVDRVMCHLVSLGYLRYGKDPGNMLFVLEDPK